MALRNIVKSPDEILRKKSREVTAFDDRLHTLLDDMVETMNEANGVGLAAVQVGVLKRAFIVDVGEGVTEYINPVMLELSGSQTGTEGCLSFPGEWGDVERANFVKIKAYDRNGKEFIKTATELEARALQHEYDHLEARCFVDIAENLETE